MKLGADHGDALSSMNNLANCYSAMGRDQEALALREETLKLRKAAFGADHADTLMSMNNLADSYSAVERYDDALKLFEETLTLRKAKLGVDHPDTLESMNNLATCFSDLGRLQEALELKEETLKRRKMKLGATHPDTLQSMNNLANGYAAVGRHQEALALREETFKLRQAKLGSDHPSTLSSMNKLANSYLTLGRQAEAAALYEQTALGVERRNFQVEIAGEVVHATIRCCEQMKDFIKAESWRRKWLALSKEKYGADSLEYGHELLGLCGNLIEQKRYTEAEVSLRECVPLLTSKEPESGRTFYALVLLGTALAGQKEYIPAEQKMLQGMEGISKVLKAPPRSPADRRFAQAKQLDSCERLIQLYSDWGKTAEAAKWRTELDTLKAAKEAEAQAAKVK